jgi:YVTN family beta-propeller protein
MIQMTFGKALIRLTTKAGALVLCVYALVRCSAAPIPSPALLVVHNGSKLANNGGLAVVDPLTNRVVGHVPINGKLHQVALSADGEFAFVTRSDHGDENDAIVVVDLGTQKVLREFNTGPGSIPHAIVFAGGELYFTAEGYKLLGRYDPAKNKIDWMLGTGENRTHMFAISKDLKTIFAANSVSGTVTALEYAMPKASEYEGGKYQVGHPATVSGGIPDDWKLTNIPVGTGAEGLAFSPDEKEVWVTCRFDGTVVIIDAATKKVSQTISLNSKLPLIVDFMPDGKKAVIISNDKKGEVLIYDTKTRTEIKRIENVGAKIGENGLHQALISPDGSHAYVSDVDANTVSVIDLKTLEVTSRIVTGDAPEGMAWVGR